MDTSELDYHLPPEAIAQEAIEPRDAARLLDSSSLDDHVFADLPSLLAPGDLLVVNQTRVRAARLHGRRRDTGGAVELLMLRDMGGGRWEALAKPARRLRPGIVIDTEALALAIVDKSDGTVVVEPLDRGVDVAAVLEATGTVPLPPYFHGVLADPERYQTVFAAHPGSAAAPTAGLHFTDALVTRLAAAGIEIAAVELDVGLDTFRPIASARVEDHRIHRERYDVPESTVAAVKRTREREGRVVAVGTTVVRTLETAAAGGGLVAAGSGESSLFIVPGHRFGVVDAVVTNFHAPRTSLIALVAALIGDRWRDVYATALERGYRFLSFGDAMLVPHVDRSAGSRDG